MFNSIVIRNSHSIDFISYTIKYLNKIFKNTTKQYIVYENEWRTFF